MLLIIKYKNNINCVPICNTAYRNILIWIFRINSLRCETNFVYGTPSHYEVMTNRNIYINCLCHCLIYIFFLVSDLRHAMYILTLRFWPYEIYSWSYLSIIMRIFRLHSYALIVAIFCSFALCLEGRQIPGRSISL